jgi:hypothetical protein
MNEGICVSQTREKTYSRFALEVEIVSLVTHRMRASEQPLYISNYLKVVDPSPSIKN